MNVKKQDIAIALLIGLLAAISVDPAFAQTGISAAPTSAGMTIPGDGQSIGAVAGNITKSLKGVSVLITMMCYLGALVFGFVGALKWKAYGERPEQTPFKIPMTYWGIAVLLAGFPEFLGTGISTLWGAGGTGGPSLVKEP